MNGNGQSSSVVSQEIKGDKGMNGANGNGDGMKPPVPVKAPAKAKSAKGKGVKGNGKPVKAPAKTGKAKGKNGKAPANAKAKATAKPAPKTPATKDSPYRPTSSYGKIFAILKAHPQGMTRTDLVKAGVKATGKPEKNVGYDVAVVASPSEDGTAHPCANRAADRYWVEKRDGGLLRIHLR